MRDDPANGSLAPKLGSSNRRCGPLSASAAHFLFEQQAEEELAALLENSTAGGGKAKRFGTRAPDLESFAEEDEDALEVPREASETDTRDHSACSASFSAAFEPVP